MPNGKFKQKKLKHMRVLSTGPNPAAAAWLALSDFPALTSCSVVNLSKCSPASGRSLSYG